MSIELTFIIVVALLFGVFVINSLIERGETRAWVELCDLAIASCRNKDEIIKSQDEIIKDQNRIIVRQMERIAELECEGEEWKQV